MKKAVIMILAAVLAAFCVSASAMEVKSVKINDVSNSIVTVEGTLDEYTNNSLITIFTAKKDNSEIKHIDVFGVDYEGNFSYAFKLVDVSGIYNITLKAGNEEKTVELNYTNPEELKIFIKALSEGKIKDVFEGLTEYKTGLGLDLTPFITERDKNVAVKRISEKKTQIGKALNENNLDIIAEIVGNAAKETELLHKLEKTTLWSSVYSVLEEGADIIGLDFSLYNKLTQDRKMYVCSALAGRNFADADKLKQEFDKLVSEAPSETVAGGSGGSSGGVKGGGAFAIGGGALTGNTALSNSIFADLPLNHWAYADIKALAEKKIIAGKSASSFEPEASITREEFVKIAVLAFSYYDENAETGLSDVDSNAWYYRYVASAEKNGIIKGRGENEFGIGGNITRQEMAVMLYRIASERGMSFENKYTDFADYDKISEYAYDAVAYMSGAGIINGMENNTFNPDMPATRAQAAKLINSMIGRFQN